MNGIRMIFHGMTGWDLLPDEEVSGFESTVQCALVNMAMQRGSSRMHPEAGTDLLAQGVYGLLTDLNTTKHAANFAAAETREFINGNTASGPKMSNLFLQPSVFAPPRLELNAVFISDSQEQIGILLTS